MSSSPLFDSVAPAELRDIERMATFRSYSAGQILYGPGDAGQLLFFLTRGSVRLYRITPSGRRVVIDMLGDGAVFGEMALVGYMMYSTFAEVSEDCTVATLSRSDVQGLIVRIPLVGMNLINILGRRLLVAEDVIERLAHPAIPARVASLLLAVMDDKGEVKGLSHGDLADRCGVRRETTTRALNELRSLGMIELARERIQVLDATKLRAVSAAE